MAWLTQGKLPQNKGGGNKCHNNSLEYLQQLVDCTKLLLGYLSQWRSMLHLICQKQEILITAKILSTGKVDNATCCPFIGLSRSASAALFFSLAIN